MNTKKIAIMASMMMLVVAFAGVPALTIDASDAATDDSGIVDVYFKGPSGDLQSTTHEMKVYIVSDMNIMGV